MLTKVTGGEVKKAVSKKLARLEEITKVVKEKETQLIKDKIEIKGDLSSKRQELAKNVIVDPVAGAIDAVKTTLQNCVRVIRGTKGIINDLKFKKKSVIIEISDVRTGETEIKRLGHSIQKAEEKRAKLLEERAHLNTEIRAEDALGTKAEKQIEKIANRILEK